MYRDVEQGMGVLDSVLHITLEGPRLPWVVTLERLGYGSAMPLTLLLLAVASVGVLLLWSIRVPEAGRRFLHRHRSLAARTRALRVGVGRATNP
jgi:hypothetical protein